MLERERPLRAARRASAGDVRRAPASRARSTPSTKRADPLELLVADRRIPGAHDLQPGRSRVAQVDRLEQPVHCVADLRRGQADRARHRAAPLAQARDALGVVAVRAALEERERRVRQAPHAVDRRRRHRHELRQPVAARGRRRRELGEQRELPVLRRRAPRSPARPPRSAPRRSTRTRNVAPLALELDRRPRPPRAPRRTRAARAPSRSACPGARVDRARTRSAGRSRASSRRSRGAAARRARPRARPRAPRRSRTRRATRRSRDARP